MKRTWLWLILVVAGVALLGLTVVGPRSPFRLTQPPPTPESPAGRSEAPTAEDLTRTDEQGTVAVAVTFLNPSDPRAFPKDLAFAVYLDTHTGDLSTYDVAANAVLTDDRNQVLSSGFSWKAETEGAHHRSGELRIRNRLKSGGVFWDARTRLLRLELKNLAGIPSRKFEWRFD